MEGGERRDRGGKEEEDNVERGRGGRIDWWSASGTVHFPRRYKPMPS